jgi:tRNA A-37 threonylcarbamoyl transferase component Bud32/TolB-like protein
MTDLREQLQIALGAAYTIERELGGGGMSRVFVATENALGRHVVIKVLAPELAAAVSAERFAREVKLAASLQHPQIVPVLTAGAAGDIPYYTMPLVDGESLRGKLTRIGSFSISDAMNVLRDVAKALEYAHAHGVVHRDIKPDNVLIIGSSAAVTDFGIAKAVSASKTAADRTELTQIGTSIGTPAYMAPEQAAGDPATDHRADIYAFGCMAYELLAGKPPFSGRPPHQLFLAHASEAPAPVQSARADAPATLARLVMRCLEKAPQSRPQSASELLRELDSVATPSAHATTSFGSAVPRGRMTAILAGVAALAIAVAGFFAWRARSTVAVDTQVVAIVPFRVAGADPSVRYLREGMPDLLAAKLSSAGGIRAVDSRTLTAAWRNAGGTNDTDLPQSDALGVAARVGAGQLLAGDIVGDSRRLTISATLVGAPDGREQARASVEGAADSLPLLVDRLAARLITVRAGQEAQLADLTASLPALRAYLDGQRANREGRWTEAVKLFQTALDTDSNFILSAVGFLEAAGWAGAQPEARARAERIAHANRARLGKRDLARLNLSLGPRYPDVRTAPDYMSAAESLLVVAPDAPDAWYHLGDAFFHFGKILDVPNSAARAVRAMERAVELDSTFAPALSHLPELYVELGDSVALRRSLETLSDSGDLVAASRYLAHVVLGDSAKAREMHRTLRRADPGLIGGIGRYARLGYLPMTNLALADSLRHARAATTPDRLAASWLSAVGALDRGQPKLAAKHIAQIDSLDAWGFTTTAYLSWDGDSAAAEESARNLRRVAGKVDLNHAPARISRMGALSALARFELSRGDTATAGAFLQRLRQLQIPTSEPSDDAIRREQILLLETQFALHRRSPDLRQHLMRLDSAMRIGRANDVTIMGPLLSARGWEALNEPARALASIRRQFRLWGAPDPFLSTLLREEGRLAALTGDRAAAMRAYRHFLHLRHDPEPSLRTDTERVRAELRRLEQAEAPPPR